MRRILVDTNVFVRLFAEDDERQQHEAAALMHRAAAGEVELVVGPPVLFELAWTLRTAYGLSREKTLDALCAVASARGVVLLDGALAAEALRLAAEADQEFADAYIAASARAAGVDALATFNRRHFAGMAVELEKL